MSRFASAGIVSSGFLYSTSFPGEFKPTLMVDAKKSVTNNAVSFITNDQLNNFPGFYKVKYIIFNKLGHKRRRQILETNLNLCVKLYLSYCF